ncbi:MAG: site-specific integrase [Acidobacteriota bacterium]
MSQDLIKSELKQELEKFDYAEQSRPFVLKSLSVETRRTYQTHIKEFFKHPVYVTPTDVIFGRDTLIKKGSRPTTVATKLSAIRLFFDYLRDNWNA